MEKKPGMLPRKLVQSGLASHTVALPKDWIVKNNLKKGDHVYLAEQEGSIVITPEPKKEALSEEQQVIDVDDKEEASIRREIIAGYLNNYQLLKLKGKKIPHVAKGIKAAASNLIGMELIDENSSMIVLKSFVHLADANPQEILRRVDNVIRSMILDSLEIPKDPSLVEAIRERDESVNKFLFLLLRVVKATLKNPSIARELKLKPVDALFFWELALHLEKIGDGVKRYARNVHALSKNGKLPTQVLPILKEYLSFYEDAMKSFYLKNTEVGDRVCNFRGGLAKKCDQFEAAQKTIDAAHFSAKVKSLLSHLSDIAHLARYGN